jgi:iron complex outermembrane receptor protein
LTQLGSQRIMDRCFEGDASYCSLLVRGAPAPGQTLGLITIVNNLSRNLIAQNARGIDFEASYNMPLSTIAEEWDGNLQFRGLATKVLRLNSIDLDGIVQRGAGVSGSVSTGAPLTADELKYIVSIGYTSDSFSGTITMRGESSGVYHRDAIVCTSGCPVSTINVPTFSMNHIPARKQFDLNLSYKFMDEQVTTFFVVDNLFNEPLALRYGNLGNGYYANTNADEGRTFRAGIRFAM